MVNIKNTKKVSLEKLEKESRIQEENRENKMKNEIETYILNWKRNFENGFIYYEFDNRGAKKGEDKIFSKVNKIETTKNPSFYGSAVDFTYESYDLRGEVTFETESNNYLFQKPISKEEFLIGKNKAIKKINSNLNRKELDIDLDNCREYQKGAILKNPSILEKFEKELLGKNYKKNNKYYRIVDINLDSSNLKDDYLEYPNIHIKVCVLEKERLDNDYLLSVKNLTEISDEEFNKKFSKFKNKMEVNK